MYRSPFELFPESLTEKYSFYYINQVCLISCRSSVIATFWSEAADKTVQFSDQTLYVLTTATAEEATRKKEMICFEIIREEQETQRNGISVDF